MLDQVVEGLDVHLQGQGLELGRDLLQPESLADPDGDRLVLRHEQGRDHLVGGHVLAQDERPGLELAGQAALGGDEHERPRVAEQALVGEPLADRGGRVAVDDRELDVGRVACSSAAVRTAAEVLADEIGHERQVERARVVRRPADDGAGDDGPEDRQRRRRGRGRRGRPGRARAGAAHRARSRTRTARSHRRSAPGPAVLRRVGGDRSPGRRPAERSARRRSRRRSGDGPRERSRGPEPPRTVIGRPRARPGHRARPGG